MRRRARAEREEGQRLRCATGPCVCHNGPIWGFPVGLQKSRWIRQIEARNASEEREISVEGRKRARARARKGDGCQKMPRGFIVYTEIKFCAYK